MSPDVEKFLRERLDVAEKNVAIALADLEECNRQANMQQTRVENAVKWRDELKAHFQASQPAVISFNDVKDLVVPALKDISA